MSQHTTPNSLSNNSITETNTLFLTGLKEEGLNASLDSNTEGGLQPSPRISATNISFEGSFHTTAVSVAQLNIEERVTPDVNIYQQKKTLAQGMMDLALLSANANQLRYVFDSKSTAPYYFVSLILISSSLILQVGVGVMLVWNCRYDVNHHNEMLTANMINNLTVISIFFVTVINVFICVFTLQGPMS